MTVSPAAASAPHSARNDRSIGIWLLACCAMVFAMAVIGAITRLTESGLSIMEWAPLAGILPPLSSTEWERLFALYRRIPEYRDLNLGMSLAEFKAIFWWEYLHRLWGRLIALVFAGPFLWFLLRRRLRRSLAPHLVTIFVLGGFQGLLGWYMVASGFAERSDVSQYRLVAHLGAAVAIYGYILWVALGLLDPSPAPSADRRASRLRALLVGFTGLVGMTLVSGGFVAGLNAGLVHNTFPLMDGTLVPEDYLLLQPFGRNLFENATAVQFNHRVLAALTLGAALVLWLWSRRLALAPEAHRACALLGLLAAVQFTLGVSVLLLAVPVWLGALHQAGALLLLGLGLWAIHQIQPGWLQPGINPP